jgi:hypothetical protein
VCLKVVEKQGTCPECSGRGSHGSGIGSRTTCGSCLGSGKATYTYKVVVDDCFCHLLPPEIQPPPSPVEEGLPAAA